MKNKNGVWLVKKIRMFSTGIKDEFSIDSVWSSREKAEEYLNRITDRYDDDLKCWIADFRCDHGNNGHYEALELYTIFGLRVLDEEEEWWL